MNGNRNFNKKANNAWYKNDNQQSRKPNSKQQKATGLTKAENKFQQVHNKLQEAVKKYAIDCDSSSEEEELETGTIIDSILKIYNQTGNQSNGFNRTQEVLTETFSTTSTCLICISSVKRSDSTWSCLECYCLFHLLCIQRWSKDTLVQQKLALEGPVIVSYNRKIAWGCPKCRQEYDAADIPTSYLCFCKKLVNPTYQPLLAPHSCGETCRKALKPNCGHSCLLLCHPGPCPPCPQTVKIPCYCGAQSPKIQRCSNKEWSCGSPCKKLLMCQKHQCTENCHDGDCPPCSKKSIQKCICGLNSKLRDCSTPMWQCDSVCNKPLECGQHNCLEVCHIGECEACFLSKPRTCPCGKKSHVLPCTEDTPTCGDTCGKLLECGLHVCNERCHKDNCGACLETVSKVCRCELHTKDIQCKKLYLCETKCKEIRDCGKHPCNRKCCDKNCPPCEKPCSRTLPCGNHKCTSICHRGPCYPCNLTETVACNCGKTAITVACGRKYKTKPPKCNKLCMTPPNCHHQKRENHKCHFGDCPPCKQICSKSRPNCSHNCPASCHSAVLVKFEGEKASMPWEQVEPHLELKALPCPDCTVPVPVICLGKHETSDWPCHLARVSSCGRPCGRLLECGNHSCTLMCHEVENPVDDIKAGDNCEKCQSLCTKPRPEGCQHTCLKPCHPGQCSPCKQMIRLKCHCGLNQPYVLCNVLTSTDNKENLRSCGDQCPRNYECGHRCRSNCHPGECISPELCKKKVKVTCSCKRIKKEMACEVARTKLVPIKCDELCLQKLEEEQKVKNSIMEAKKEMEEIKNKIELERYEKKLQGKKRTKERRYVNQVEEKSWFQKYKIIILSFLVVLFSVFAYFVIR